MNSTIESDKRHLSKKKRLLILGQRYWHVLVLIPLVVWYYYVLGDFNTLPNFGLTEEPDIEWLESLGIFLKSTGYFLILFTFMIAFRIIPKSNRESEPTMVFILRYWHIPVFIGLIVWYYNALKSFNTSPYGWVELLSDSVDKATLEWWESFGILLKSTGHYLVMCTIVIIFRIIPMLNIESDPSVRGDLTTKQSNE
jgi:hypothetical protein